MSKADWQDSAFNVLGKKCNASDEKLISKQLSPSSSVSGASLSHGRLHSRASSIQWSSSIRVESKVPIEPIPANSVTHWHSNQYKSKCVGQSTSETTNHRRNQHVNSHPQCPNSSCESDNRAAPSIVARHCCNVQVNLKSADCNDQDISELLYQLESALLVQFPEESDETLAAHERNLIKTSSRSRSNVCMTSKEQELIGCFHPSDPESRTESKSSPTRRTSHNLQLLKCDESCEQTSDINCSSRCSSKRFARFIKAGNTVFFLSVDLSENNLTCKGVCMLSSWLMKNLSHVRLRHLKMFKNCIADKGALALAELILAQPSALEELHLSHNRISDVGAAALFKSFSFAERSDTSHAEQSASGMPIPPRRKQQAMYQHYVYPRAVSAGGNTKTTASSNNHLPVWIRLEYNNINDTASVLRNWEAECRQARNLDPFLKLTCFAERVSAPRCNKDPHCSPARCLRAANGNSPLLHLYSFYHQSALAIQSTYRQTPKISSYIVSCQATKNHTVKHSSTASSKAKNGTRPGQESEWTQVVSDSKRRQHKSQKFSNCSSASSAETDLKIMQVRASLKAKNGKNENKAACSVSNKHSGENFNQSPIQRLKKENSLVAEDSCSIRTSNQSAKRKKGLNDRQKAIQRQRQPQALPQPPAPTLGRFLSSSSLSIDGDGTTIKEKVHISFSNQQTDGKEINLKSQKDTCSSVGLNQFDDTCVNSSRPISPAPDIHQTRNVSSEVCLNLNTQHLHDYNKPSSDFFDVSNNDVSGKVQADISAAPFRPKSLSTPCSNASVTIRNQICPTAFPVKNHIYVSTFDLNKSSVVVESGSVSKQAQAKIEVNDLSESASEFTSLISGHHSTGAVSPRAFDNTCDQTQFARPSASVVSGSSSSSHQSEMSTAWRNNDAQRLDLIDEAVVEIGGVHNPSGNRHRSFCLGALAPSKAEAKGTEKSSFFPKISSDENFKRQEAGQGNERTQKHDKLFVGMQTDAGFSIERYANAGLRHSSTCLQNVNEIPHAWEAEPTRKTENTTPFAIPLPSYERKTFSCPSKSSKLTNSATADKLNSDVKSRYSQPKMPITSRSTYMLPEAMNRTLGNYGIIGEKQTPDISNYEPHIPLYIFPDASAFSEMRKLIKDNKVNLLSFPGLVALCRHQVICHNEMIPITRSVKSHNSHNTEIFDHTQSLILMVVNSVEEGLLSMTEKEPALLEALMKMHKDYMGVLGKFGIVEAIEGLDDRSCEEWRYLDEDYCMTALLNHVPIDAVRVMDFALLWAHQLAKMAAVRNSAKTKGFNNGDALSHSPNTNVIAPPYALFVTNDSAVENFFNHIQGQNMKNQKPQDCNDVSNLTALACISLDNLNNLLRESFPNLAAMLRTSSCFDNLEHPYMDATEILSASKLRALIIDFMIKNSKHEIRADLQHIANHIDNDSVQSLRMNQTGLLNSTCVPYSELKVSSLDEHCTKPSNRSSYRSFHKDLTQSQSCTQEKKKTDEHPSLYKNDGASCIQPRTIESNMTSHGSLDHPETPYLNGKNHLHMADDRTCPLNDYPLHNIHMKTAYANAFFPDMPLKQLPQTILAHESSDAATYQESSLGHSDTRHIVNENKWRGELRRAHQLLDDIIPLLENCAQQSIKRKNLLTSLIQRCKSARVYWESLLSQRNISSRGDFMSKTAQENTHEQFNTDYQRNPENKLAGVNCFLDQITNPTQQSTLNNQTVTFEKFNEPLSKLSKSGNRPLSAIFTQSDQNASY